MKVVRYKLLSLMLVLILFCSIFTGCGKSEANVWLADSIAPTSSTKGNDGDMYLNTSNYDLYQMKNSKWIKIGNIKGEKGDKGDKGDTPTIEISDDGYWVINGKKTNTRAQGRDGKDGKDGISPLISISEDGYWVINGIKTAVKAKAQDGKDGQDGANGKDGKDGLVPTIEFSEDGYWVINGVKTKIKAKGEDGKTPTIAISEDGYWVINGIKTKIKAECKNCITQYQEAENIEVPDLYNYTLTPVVYDGTNWKVADIRKKWYSYKDQEWANAVLLDSSVTKNVGDTVKVDGTEALAMYVWIPKYEYKIDSAYGKGGTIAAPGEIEINFISQEVSTSSSDDYIIHPAFTFGDTKLSGMWVAKFEISHETLSNSNSRNTLNCSTETCTNANGIRILPNMKSLRNNNVSNFFYGIKSMEQRGNVFGIDSNVTDSHMIKNSEWGAVAYLSQSKYGKYGNGDYTGVNKEIYLNNSSNYYTGRSLGATPNNGTTSESGTYSYDVAINGTGASTTGNITGIYDMSGGAWEYTMGVFANSEGILWSGYDNVYSNSGFTGKVGSSGIDFTGKAFPDSKYYDKYSAYSGNSITNYLTACNNGPCYGHSLQETAGWYENYKNLVGVNGPWIGRSGAYNSGTSAGIFGMTGIRGGNAATNTTRAVLVSKKKNNTLQTYKTYKTYKNGEVVYYDVQAGKSCENYKIGNSKTGYNGIDNKTSNQNSCLKFYAFNDDGSSSLNLILDHNTTATSVWNTNGDNSTGPTEVLEKLKESTKVWKGTITPSNYTTGTKNREYTINYNGYTSRLLTADEVARISGYVGYDENKVGIAFFLDSNTAAISKECKEGNITGCKYGWLYDRTSETCTKGGCLNNSDVETSGYWTISSSITNSSDPLHKEYCNGYVTYGISFRGRLGYACPNYVGHYGVRPVIEVLKSNL